MSSYKYTVWFFILTIPLGFLAIFAAGGGHGTYFPLLAIFPFSLLGTFFNEEIPLLIGIIQLPAYGFLMDKFGTKKVLPVIIVIHIIGMCTVFMLKRDYFFS
ncbi:hypothetical protein [Chryseobacterium sediminis]|uniref:MFS transporter n=1 Tax=Chryseobacterium sediminis TaxID=1679494 RepID=A0A5B2U2I6_9FLAO|nr:hypothetical protein [Chryseobacterium sediminis]KAA2220405.1 hypothetical protein FW780_16130 [Chryseobacterium sediminis]MBB6329323.1 hypothetical protein [Chryseobacterium sediminis]